MNQNQQHYYLQQMGIPVWVERNAIILMPSLTDLQQQVATCTQCSLHKTRTQTVFARGNPQSKLMIIGEAPGFYEDKQGLPFVGKAGQLLDQMVKSIDLTSEDVYIANVLKCRPPDNRDPQMDEIAACSAYLSQQISLVQPKIILALGRFAAQFLVQNNMPLNQLRNKLHTYHEVPCLVSYHPAYLLRNPADKKKAFSDWLFLQQWLVNN